MKLVWCLGLFSVAFVACLPLNPECEPITDSEPIVIYSILQPTNGSCPQNSAFFNITSSQTVDTCNDQIEFNTPFIGCLCNASFCLDNNLNCVETKP